jgi:uncharacterized protein
VSRHAAVCCAAKRYDFGGPGRPREIGDGSLKIEREDAAGQNVFSAYGEGWVEVSGRRVSGSLVVAAERLLEGWAAGGIGSLTAGETATLVEWNPEIVLLGSGATFRFPDPAALAPLYQAGIGVEVMDTKAACRTYNILLAEGRRVVAALVVSDTVSG